MKRPSATRAKITAPSTRDKVAMSLVLSGLTGIFGGLPVMLAHGMTPGCVTCILGFVLLACGADMAGKAGR